MRRFGEILIDNKLITAKDLQEALNKQKSLEKHKPLGEVMVDLELISIQTLMDFLEIQLLNKPSS